MKVVRKLKTPEVSESGLEKTYEVVVNDDMRQILSDLPEFDSMILTPIKLTDSQHTFLKSVGRTLFLVSYLPRRLLQWSCESCGASHFAFIEHYKDKNPDGSDKKTHFHVILNFDYAEYFSRVSFFFRTVEIRAISTQSVKREWDYLTHNSEQCRKDKKVPYDVSEIVSDDFGYWQGRYISVDDSSTAIDMFDDYMRGLSPRKMVERYGFKYFTYIKALRSCRDEQFGFDLGGTVPPKNDYLYVPVWDKNKQAFQWKVREKGVDDNV